MDINKISNQIYKVLVTKLEGLEHEGLLKRNGHHVAQELTEDIKELLDKIADGFLGTWEPGMEDGYYEVNMHFNLEGSEPANGFTALDVLKGVWFSELIKTERGVPYINRPGRCYTLLTRTDLLYKEGDYKYANRDLSTIVKAPTPPEVKVEDIPRALSLDPVVEEKTETVLEKKKKVLPTLSATDMLLKQLETFNEYTNLSTLATWCHTNACTKGWYDNGPRNIGEQLMLVVTEIDEAYQGRETNLVEELADIVIRVLDLAGSLSLDLGSETLHTLTPPDSTKGAYHPGANTYEVGVSLQLFKVTRAVANAMEVIRITNYKREELTVALLEIIARTLILTTPLTLLQAVLDKCKVNLNRPYKHGKEC